LLEQSSQQKERNHMRSIKDGSLCDFIGLTHDFQSVKRQIYTTGSNGKWENDAEHSYQLQAVVLYVNKTGRHGLRDHKLMWYSKVHDWPELHHKGSFDVSAFSSDLAEKETKEARELETMKMLEVRLAHYPAFLKALREYHARRNQEAKFVYAWDKLLPIINIYKDGGLSWKMLGVTLEDMIREREHKIAVCPITFKYYKAFLPLLIAGKDELFYKKGQVLNQMELFDSHHVVRVRTDIPTNVLPFPARQAA